ncbi:5'-methylthioadenosine phosphorylase [Nocardioides scoriae]|uniref:Purine nucleoside phosphorylase n=1 Tax=Nocardioides scoriae TaxID=642780 RepID=A0A1H1RQR4_9ACTN|nr:S-methyl-5'-thioadenosine phosphorylase [Nocardioides scoriae]SDS38068.1 5'-methylthioadenosine phosphorylase [Nocardioides scoriae]
MTDRPTSPTPRVAVIGGSGFYEFLENPTTVTVETPYGAPSAPIAVGEVAGRPVAFLPRHGKGHQHPPTQIPYRANLWALKSLGVEQVLAPCAVGGLQPETQPGTLVVPDQLVDRTTRRVQTYVETGACHAPFADPYCPDLRGALVAAAGEGTLTEGAMVVIEGPRFSTRAESQSYAREGWTIVNMTGHPEAVLARELGLCYATIALVTDMDAGVSAEESVDQAQVFALFERHIGRLKEMLGQVVAELPPVGSCGCADWLADVDLPFELPGPDARTEV